MQTWTLPPAPSPGGSVLGEIAAEVSAHRSLLLAPPIRQKAVGEQHHGEAARQARTGPMPIGS